MTTTSPKRPESARIAWTLTLGIGGLPVGALLALIPGDFTGQALVVGLLLYELTAGLGVYLIDHRLLTHRSLATRPGWLENILAEARHRGAGNLLLLGNPRSDHWRMYGHEPRPAVIR